MANIEESVNSIDMLNVKLDNNIYINTIVNTIKYTKQQVEEFCYYLDIAKNINRLRNCDKEFLRHIYATLNSEYLVNDRYCNLMFMLYQRSDPLEEYRCEDNRDGPEYDSEDDIWYDDENDDDENEDNIEDNDEDMQGYDVIPLSSLSHYRH